MAWKAVVQDPRRLILVMAAVVVPHLRKHILWEAEAVLARKDVCCASIEMLVD